MKYISESNTNNTKYVNVTIIQMYHIFYLFISNITSSLNDFNKDVIVLSNIFFVIMVSSVTHTYIIINKYHINSISIQFTNS